MHPVASRPLSSRITLAIAFLAALAVVLFAAFAWFAALKADEEALRREKALVERGLTSLRASIPHQQESFSIWDEAVVHTDAGDEQWLEENFAGWMHRFFDCDRSYVLDARGRLLLSSQGHDAVFPPRYEGDRLVIKRIASRLRHRLADRFHPSGKTEKVARADIYVADIQEISGFPAIVSARPILPHTDKVKLAEGDEDIFVVMKFIDAGALVAIAHSSLVTNLQYEPAAGFRPRPASVPIASDDGRIIGYLTWTPKRPGLKLIGEVAPWAGLALVIAAGVGLHQGRSLRHASIELHASEGRARHLAYHDVLTGLANRALFEERLDTLLAAVRQGEGEAAVLFLDLDRFKSVNDTLGHYAGDQLMRKAAGRLEKAVGAAGTIARVGGDEFAIAIADRDAPGAAGRLSERLLAAVEAPFHLDEEVVHVGLSIGIAAAPMAGVCRDQLLRKADIALYEAKKRGRGRYQFFSEAMGDIVRQRQTVEADLRKALTSGEELQLAYQPLYSAEGRLTGAEALLRWNHPAHRSISPMFLVTIAEECGLIVQLGEWVLSEACRMASRVPVPWIAVNVSPVQLRDPGFARRCLDIIARHGIPPQRIQVEITEAVVIENPQAASAILRELRTAGVRVALDDFGTGYSSMSYLQNYPLDRLKIDRFFIHALGEGEEGRAIVAAMIEMARALKLDVTAEGVETPEQRDVLKAMGCREMQGFLFSRPVSGEAFAESFFAGRAERRA